MISIIQKPFNSEMQARLANIHDTYHANELSQKPLEDLPPYIHLIEVDGNLAGYGVVWELASPKELIQKAEQYYFREDEKYLQKDFYIEIKNSKNFIFIEALDILKDFEGKGYAKYFVNWLKEQYPNKRMYVYSIDKSQNFWFKQDFEVLGKTPWMTFN